MKRFIQKIIRIILVSTGVLVFLISWNLLEIQPVHAGGGNNAQQMNYRFRLDLDALNDDTNGWLAAENSTATDLAKTTTYRVRFTASQEGTYITRNITPQLEYGTNADCSTGMTVVPVTATTEHFEMALSGQFADEDATTTNLLQLEEANWQNGEGYESSNPGTNFNLDVDVYTEYEFSFTPTVNASDGGTYYMRMSNDFDGITECAALTIATPANITVSGNLYVNETGTPYDCSTPEAVTIKVSVDGAAAQSADCTLNTGYFEVTANQPAGAGSEVVVYVDSGETPNATTVTLAADSGSNIIGLHMYQNRVAVTYEAGSLISNADLLTADNSDAGIRYAVTGTDLLTDSGMELHVWTGKTYDPGGQVDTTSGDLHLDDNATAYIDTAGSVIDGDIIVDGGSTGTTLQFQDNATVAGGAITTPDGGGTNATVNYTGTPTVTVTGTGNIGGGTSPTLSFYGLTIGTATAAATTLASNATVAGLLTVDASDSLSINSSITLSNTGSSDVAGTGTISGAGTLRFTNASGGAGTTLTTLSSIVRYDASAGNILSTTFDARTYSGLVEIFSDDSAGVNREVAMVNSTYTLSGASSHLHVINNSATYTLTLDGALNPTVAVGGDLDFTGSGVSSEIITSGTGTWTVSGNVNFTDGTYTATAGNTLTMDSTGTLTSNAQTLQNLTLSGSSITLANATHTIAGNLNMSGTVSAGTSTVTITGTVNSIVGGGNTLNILNIDPSSAGTITLQTSNLTVTSTLTVAAGDALSIDTVSLTHTDASDVAGTGNITGTGTLIFDDGSGGPGTGITTLSSAVRFDASGGNVLSTTFDARTYGGQVEFYIDNSGPAAARSVAFAASTYTISGASSHLYLRNDNDTHTLTLDGSNNPTVNIGGDLDFTGTGASSEAITTGTGTWTVSGNIDLTDGDVTFTTGTPDNTFQVNGTSKTITSADEIFQNLSIIGTGDVSNLDLLTVAGNFSISASATFEHGNNVDFTAKGDGITAFVIENGGTFDSATAGTGKLILDGVDNDQWFDDKTDPGEQNMGNVQIGSSPGVTKLKNDFAAANLTIATGDAFETHGWEVDIAGFIDCQGTGHFDLEDDVPNNEGNGTIVTFGGNWTMSATGTLTVSTDSRVEPDGTADQTVATGGKAFWDFYSNNSAALDADDDVIVSAAFDVDGDLTVNDGELDLNTNNPATDVEGDVVINAGAELSAPSSLNAAGIWNNNGTFTKNSSTVTFDSDDAAAIDAGTGNFNIVVFDNAAGSWTIQNDNMTTDGNLTLTAANAFTLQAALTLEVKGDFTLTVLDAVTTWNAGSILYLNGSGGMYNINTKTHGGDDFVTLRIGASEDIAMWDSDATTFTIDGGGCLFSQDHGHPGVAGRLNIYGTCTSRANEYWSYAKDFEDGAVVARQADVRFTDGALLTVDNGDTLEITGQNAGANRSLVTNQGAGNYGLTIDGTIDAQYYNFDYLDDSGVNITATATVTELADGNFDNAKAGAASSYITVTGINQTKEFRSCVFDDNGDGADGNVVYNVNADGANILWKFLLWDGNKGGESFDNEANNAIVDWSENLSFSLSANVMNLGVINTLIVGSDNHTITVTTNAVNGYTCSAAEDGNIRSGANDINDVGDNTVDAGTEEYGISCAGADCIDAVNDQAIPLDVVSNVGRVTASVATITYKAAADALTVGTTFSHIVTYTCAGDF